MSLENIVLKNESAGTIAEVLPALGFNCHRFAAARGGQLIEVLYADANFAQGAERASGSGTPILFPFPGRIPGTVLNWQGRDYSLTAGDGRGNAIHGFVHTRPWRVIERSATRVVGQFHAQRDDAALLGHWPADFRITATYVLNENALQMHYLVENPGDTPLPCGLGTHPYFRLPLGGDDAGACLVRLPMHERWELADMLPTGRRLPIARPDQFAAGQTFAGMKFDDVFTGLEFHDGWCEPAIHDPGSGATAIVRFDDAFRECVVYTPPHRRAICIEPYTCVPGPFELTARGVDAGLRILPPGGSFEARVEFHLE